MNFKFDWSMKDAVIRFLPEPDFEQNSRLSCRAKRGHPRLLEMLDWLKETCPDEYENCYIFGDYYSFQFEDEVMANMFFLTFI